MSLGNSMEQLDISTTLIRDSLSFLLPSLQLPHQGMNLARQFSSFPLAALMC